MAHRSAGEATLVAALLALLLAAIAYPLLQVLSVAFLDGGMPTLRPLLAFFARPLFREAFLNTLLAGVLAVVIGSVIAVPLALLTVRYRFPGRALVPVLGVLPLVIPPFVGAVAFQQILGRSGAVNLLLLEHAGFRIPFMEGLTGVVLVQSLHYFPFILLNTAAALAGLDRSLEEAAQNLGSSGPRLFRRVLLPLALPGVVTGIALSATFQTLGLKFGLPTVIVGHATFCVVIVYNNVLARLRRNPRSAEEASADLGAASPTTFRRITLPAMRTALLAGGLLAFALSFDEVIVTNFTAGPGTETIPLFILRSIQRPHELPVVNVVAFVLVLLSVIPVYIAQRIGGREGAAIR